MRYDFLKSIDFYGEQVGFKINGNEQARSNTGGCLSLVTLLLVAIYASLKIRVMASHDDTVYQMFEKPGELDHGRAFSAEEMGLEVGFTVFAEDARNESQIAEVLEVVGRHVTSSNEGRFTKQLEMGPCE